MSQSFFLATLVVREYDEAISFFVNALGLRIAEDRPLSPSKRWVVVSPPGGIGASLLLAKAASAEQLASVGNQTGGRVAFFLETSTFQEDLARMQASGVTFTEQPREEAYGTVVVFQDLYGNKWDLIQRK